MLRRSPLPVAVTKSFVRETWLPMMTCVVVMASRNSDLYVRHFCPANLRGDEAEMNVLSEGGQRLEQRLSFL